MKSRWHFLPSICVVVIVLAGLALPVRAQTIQLGEVLLLLYPGPIEDAGQEAYEAYVMDTIAPSWASAVPGVELHLLRADRGDRAGEYLLAWIADTADRRPDYLPADDDVAFSEDVLAAISQRSFTDTYRGDERAYTEYLLVGADELDARSAVDILGIHYIKVKPERAQDFERFVRDTLHPALATSIPGMSLLYYKAVRGRDAGSYITVYAIESYARRESFWPTNAPETETLKAAFAPHNSIAQELLPYLVEDSYLPEDSGAGAAIFESLEWTDFVHVRAERPD